MKKNRIILLLAVVLWLTSSVSAATIDRIAVRSEAMKKEIPVVVIVPDAAKSGVRMPVLYLLHGYSGDQETWLNVKPSLPQMADRDSVIVVCPDGDDPVRQHIERQSGVGDRLRLRRLLFRREQQTARGAPRAGHRA